MRRTSADLRQQVRAADDFIKAARPDAGQNLTHFGGIEGDEVHHFVRIAGELATQSFVLCANTHGASIRLALADHDAAHSDQRGGADAIFLGPHHRSHDDVASGAQATIGAQCHPVAQVVHRQNLMRLGEAHLPRQTRIFDRGRGRGPGAAVVARNQDDVGLGLGHARSNRADTARRHQLDRHLAARVDLLEVIDQLRKVFDRVDVVVRRGRDQRHALGRMPQPRDQIGDLHAGKLPTLTGLGTLSDLDLQLFALVEIFRRHAKAARGHLFDLGRRIVAVAFWHEMRRIFAALAAVRFRANTVHRHVQRLMRLWGKRAQRHARRYETLADRGDALHLLQWHRRALGLDVEQVTQMDRRVALHLFRILLPHLIGRLVAGHLQHMHAARLPSVFFARLALLVETANRHHDPVALPAFGVDFFGFALNADDTDAGDTAGHAGEVLGTHGARKAHSLKV